jgi:hypothetical protein
MLEVISEISRMVPPISLIVPTESWVADCTCAIWLPISSVAFAVWVASALTSEATTAKPRSAPPARALEGRVQREQIGLLGDRRDHLPCRCDQGWLPVAAGSAPLLMPR